MTDTATRYLGKEPASIEELKTFLEISQSLHQFFNLEELLTYIIFRAKEIMDAETAAVLLHDPSRDELFFRCTEGNPREGAAKLKDIRFPAHEGIAGSVFKSGIPELIADVAADKRHYKAVDHETRFDTKSMVAVPLQTRGRVIGVLEACNKKHGTFDERDVDLMMTVAGIIAMALDNARIHAELQRAYEELQFIDKAKDNLLESTKEENDRLRRAIEVRYRFDHIKGNSPQMLELFRLCEKVIESDVTVLIEGETGTGKELIARCLHFNGPRKDRQFVTQNCGGIPESLLASELFGHKRGAFTGAISDKRGLFEVAHGGTIFLDEVSEMSPAMQVSLLRVLQEGEVRPLGADEVKMVNVRVISATNKSLEDAVRKGTFRDDLYYRLNVFTIKLPALRERSGDIEILANHFLKKFNRKMNKSVAGISKMAMECLCAYNFPGNIRELENEMERAVVLAEDGKYVEVFHLSEKIPKKSIPAECQLKTHGKLRDMIQSMERVVLLQALEEYGGNKARAARELGLSRLGLMKKIKRYGL